MEKDGELLETHSSLERHKRKKHTDRFISQRMYEEIDIHRLQQVIEETETERRYRNALLLLKLL